MLTPEQIAEMDQITGGAMFSEMDKVLAPEQGFLGKTGEDLTERAAFLDQIREEAARGDIGKAETLLNLAGGLAGAVGDVGGNIISSGAQTVDELTGGYLGDKLSSIVRGVSDLPVTPSGTTVGEAATGLAGEAAEIAEEYPRTARALGSAANVALVGIPAAKGAKSVLRNAKNVRKALRKGKIVSAEELREKGSKLYKLADEQGGSLKPEFFDDYINKLGQKEVKDPFVKRVVETGGGKDVYADIGNIAKDFRGQPLTFDRAKALDEKLGSLAYDNTDNLGKLNDVGNQYQDVQMMLRKDIEDASAGAFIGGKEVFETAKEARKYWSAQARMRDVERILENASRYDNPETVIKTGFRGLLKDGKRTKSYSPREVRAMEKAARSGDLGDVFHLMGSGLGPIAAGSAGMYAGGPIGAIGAAVPAYALRKGAKSVAEGIQKKKAKDVLRAVTQRVTEEPNIPLAPAVGGLTGKVAKTAAPISAVGAIENMTMEDIYKLPPAQAMEILRRMK